jgi:hypothetical protein
LTASVVELNYLDTTPGAGAASKAVVLDSGEDYTWPATGVLTYGGTGITATGAEINYLDIASIGTGAVSKAVVLDGSGNYTWPTAGTFTNAGSTVMNGTVATALTLSGTNTTGIAFTGTMSDALNFEGITPVFDDDSAFINIGTWNTPIDITSQTDHFVPIQVNLRSGTSVAKDIAATRLRVNTAAVGGTANTLTNVNVQEQRSKLEVDVGSHANLQVSTEVPENIACTGDLLVGYFSLQGDGVITCSNHVNVLEATCVMSSGASGVDNVGHFTMNSTGVTATNVLKAESIAGTVTSLLDLTRTAGTVTNGMLVSGTMTRAINISTTTQALSATVSAVAGGLTGSAISVYATGVAGNQDVGIAAYLDATAAGQSTANWTYGAGIWLNLADSWINSSGGWGGHEQVSPLSVGIYGSASLTTGVSDADIIYGVKAELVGDGATPFSTSHGCYFAALNVSQTAATRTAIFFAHQSGAVGLGATKSGSAGGSVALVDINGTMHYVNTWTA